MCICVQFTHTSLFCDHVNSVAIHSSLPSPPLPLYTHTLPCSLILYFPFSLSTTIVLGFLTVVTPFALVVYARYSLIAAGCMAGNISAIPRTAIVSFASSITALFFSHSVKGYSDVHW